jgi:hypothetical protein
MSITATTLGEARQRATIPAKTLRKDRWWLPPLTIGVILAVFVVYSTIRVFMASGTGWTTTNLRRSTRLLSESCTASSAHFRTRCRRSRSSCRWASWRFRSWPGSGHLLLLPQGVLSLVLALARPAPCEPHRRYGGDPLPVFVNNYHRTSSALAAAVLLINTYDASLAAHRTVASASAWARRSSG